MSDLLVFGAASLVGSEFVARTAHAVHAAGRTDPRTQGFPAASFTSVDLLDARAVAEVVERSVAEVVVNFAAATDVDGVERERPATLGAAGGPAYRLNAIAPRAMAEAAERSGKRLITLSTDFVFDGVDGPYDERAEPAPFGPKVSWYGYTKGVGEVDARAASAATAVLRIAYPFRARFAGKLDFARGLVARRRAGRLPPLFADQQFTPTWIPDVGRAVEHLIRSGERGVLHVASPELTTPWEFGSYLFGLVDRTELRLPQGSMAEFLEKPGTTPRPRRGGLKVGRLPGAGVELTGWRRALEEFVREGGAA